MGSLFLVLSQILIYLIPQHPCSLYFLEVLFGLLCVLFAQFVYTKESASIGFVFNLGLYLYYNGFLFNLSDMGIKLNYLLYLNIILMILGVLVFNLFYLLKPIYMPRRTIYHIENKDFRLALYILLFFGVLSFSSETAAFGGLANYILVGYGGERYKIFSENMASIVGSGNVWIGLSLFSLMRFEKNNKLLRYLVFVMAILWGVMNFLIGNRQILMYVTIPLLFWKLSTARRKIPFGVLMVLIVASLFFSKIYVMSRRYFVSSDETVVQILQDRAKRDNNFFNIFQGDEFTYPALSLHESMTDEMQERRWGATYFQSILNTIPVVNSAFDYKSLAKERMEKYYPSLDRQGLGLAFFFPTEAFINYGPVGVVLCFAIWGWLLKRLYVRASLSLFDQLIYLYAIPILAIDSIRMDSSNYWKLLRIYWLPVIICFVLFLFKEIIKSNGENDGYCSNNVCL